MKRCPTCRRTFEDGLTYCLVDGSVLSAPFEEEEDDVDSRVTEVLTEDPRPVPPTEQAVPAQPTISAVFEAQPQRQSPQESAPAESKPVGLIGLIGLVGVLFFVGILVLLFATWPTVSPFIGWVVLRRTPAFLMVFIAIGVAVGRIKRHVRASLLTILALIIYIMEGFFFYLLNALVIDGLEKMKLSQSAAEWVYFFVYFFEDFVFAAVIILLVAAAFTGRDRFSKLTTETP